jgi:hypothetical protein
MRKENISSPQYVQLQGQHSTEIMKKVSRPGSPQSQFCATWLYQDAVLSKIVIGELSYQRSNGGVVQPRKKLCDSVSGEPPTEI